jgi:[CysO sulfur-carrier protein]-S-L-cysteine hydrolase
VLIGGDLLAEVVAHAQRDAPDECCGVLGVRDGAVVSVHPLENLAHSPFRFEVDGKALLAVMDEIEDAGGELGVIYHSHTRSEPYPSQTDINFAAHWPGVEWLIVGTKGPEPVVRSYLIDGGTVTEVDVAHAA